MEKLVEKLAEMEIRRVGKVAIVSSGYEDRYPLARIWLSIRCDMVTYRIDNEHDRVEALLRIAGFPVTPESALIALSAINSSPFHITGTWENEDGSLAGSCKTSSGRLTAGIAVATGFPTLNEYGIANAKKDAANLTENEWKIIETGLRKINDTHRKQGRPVVDFSIPAAGELAAITEND